MVNTYVLLNNSDDSVIEEANSSRFRKTGKPPILKSEKAMRWLELVVVDPSVGQDQIKEGPVISISDTKYTRTWTVRDKTADELDAEKDDMTNHNFDMLKPIIMALNDGSFVPDSDYTVDQIKAKMKVKS
tara:strand:- start:844 stop:1233 length:390 start_codon:yes stop_codon:yes gene_type:complete